MNLVNNIGNAYYRLIAYQPSGPASHAPTRMPAVEITDTLELSEAGTAAYLFDQAKGTNLDRLLAVRNAIQNGTFETPERLQGTVNRLLDLLA